MNRRTWLYLTSAILIVSALTVWGSVASASLPTGVFQNYNQLAPAGKRRVVLRPIALNELILPTKLAGEGLGPSIAYLLPDGSTYVTHEAILGEVTAVSATSITVKSTDGTSMTFTVTADTKVHQRQPKGSTTTTTPTIADVKTGQTVLVGGEKSPDLTAKNIVVRAT